MKPLVWLVTGSIANSLSVKGVRSRLYRFADQYLGYYKLQQDTSNAPALSYDEANECTLNICVLFKNEHNALKFDSHLRAEKITFNSPFNNLAIDCNVTPTNTISLGPRIYAVDYVPTESESPQEANTVISGTGLSVASSCNVVSDEFRYQRIEHMNVFALGAGAESCHIMASHFCRKYHKKYDKDPSNRLVMSRDMHGFFDALSRDVALFSVSFVSKSPEPVLMD